MKIHHATAIALTISAFSLTGCVEQKADSSPATPPAAPLSAPTANDPTARKMDDLARRLGQGDPGQRSNALGELEKLTSDAARPGNDPQRQLLAAAIAATAAKNLPAETRVYLILQLGELSSGAEIAFVYDKDPTVRDAALAALTKDRSEAADKFLLQRLKVSKDKAAIPYIKALGAHAKPGTEEAIAAHLNSADSAQAACVALGKIGTKDAAKLLQNYVTKPLAANTPPNPAAYDALLACADRLLPDSPADALTIYAALDVDSSPAPVRIAAFRGQLLAMSGNKSLAPAKLQDQIWQAFAGRDAIRRGIVMSVLTAKRGDSARDAILLLAPLSTRFDELSVDGKVATIRIAETLGWVEFSPRVLAALSSKDPAVRAAAIDAAGTLCSADAVEPLITIAVTEQPNQNAARQSLARLRDNPQAATPATGEVDRALAKQLLRSEADYRKEALRAIAARRGDATLIFTVAEKDSDEGVRVVALEMFGQLANASHAPQIVTLLAAAKSSPERDAAESATRLVLARIEDVNKRAEILNAALAKSTGDNRLALIRLLGRTGAPSALVTIREYMKDKDASTQDAATRALVDWPNPEVLPELLEIAKSAPEESHRILAVRGYARLVAAKLDRPATDTAKLCAAILPLARPEEKRLFIASLTWAECAESFTLVVPLIDLNGTAREAMASAAKLGKFAIKTDPDLVITTMEKIIAKTQPTEEAHRNAESTLAAAQRAKASK